MSNRALVVIIFMLGFTCHVSAQDSTFLYKIDLLGSISSSNQTPFWLRSNAYGAIPDHGSFLSGRWGIYKKYHPNNPRFFKWSAGAELATNLTKKSDLFFTELYAAAMIGPIEFSIGNRKSYMGLGDSTMTMGSVAMSQNYRPYPKIEISTPNFVNLIPGKDFISFKFNYSDGLLGGADVSYGNVNYVPKIYMHQKSLYLKLGGSNNKINLYGGFNHQAMWGGEYKIFSGGLSPSLAYKYVVIGKPWANSRVGNHFGSIDLGMTVKGKTWEYFVYRQSIYEDGSLIDLSNVADGLNGVKIQRRILPTSQEGFIVKSFLIEYLFTKNQGGSIFDFDSGIFGRDNYFNHYVYPQGWSYRGRGFGTPMIDSKQYNRPELLGESKEFTINNRISALNIGITASKKQFNLVFKGTISKNEGTYGVSFDKPIYQTSLFLKTDYSLKKRSNDKISVALAGDLGKLYPNNLAIMIGYHKFGFLN